MVRFAHISDTHLGFRQYNLAEREIDFYDSFHEAIDKIIEERVDFVVHTGDLFEHHRPKVDALIHALKAFKKLNKEGIKVYAIPGNHDLQIRTGFIPPHALFQDFGVVLLGKKRTSVYLKKEDLFIAGLPYHHKHYSEILQSRINELSKAADNYKKRILLLHQGLDAYLPWEGAHELKLTDLPLNFHYYALGHIHNRIQQKYGNGYISSSGSTDIWRMDEVDNFKECNKGFTLVDLEFDEPELQYISLENIRYFEKQTIFVENFENEIKQLLEKVKKLFEISVKKPIISLDLKGKAEFENAYYVNRINQLIGNFVYNTRYNFQPISEEIRDFEESSISISEIFLKMMNNNQQHADFAEMLFEILKEKNIQDAIKLSEEFYGENW